MDKQKDRRMKGCESKLAGDCDGIQSGFNANTENPIMVLTAQELRALISKYKNRTKMSHTLKKKKLFKSIERLEYFQVFHGYTLMSPMCTNHF